MARRGENIYHRKDGRWEGRYKSGYKDNGQAKYRSIYARSYSDLREKLKILKVQQTTTNSSANMTVKELFDEWLSAVKLRVKVSTLANYKMKIDKHILSVFGKVKYAALTVQQLNMEA